MYHSNFKNNSLTRLTGNCSKSDWVFPLCYARLGSHPPLLFKLKVVLEDSSRNHRVNWNNGFMEQDNQERQPRPTEVVCLDESSDPANFSESSIYIYSFGKLWGTWDTRAGGILALRGTGNKMFLPRLDCKKAKCWFSESFRISEEGRLLASLCPQGLPLFNAISFSLLDSWSTVITTTTYVVSTRHVWGTGLRVTLFSQTLFLMPIVETA